MNGTIILDGALGTLLIERGIVPHQILWTAAAAIDHPLELQAVHRQYLSAGADVITANTFRTNPYAFRLAGLSSPHILSREYTLRSIECARKAAVKESRGKVAASLAPCADCYRPEDFPGKQAAHDNYGLMCEYILDSGADIILIETQNSLLETRIAIEHANASGLPVWVSVMVTDQGRMLSGDKPEDIYDADHDKSVEALMFNCSPVKDILANLSGLRLSPALKTGFYANMDTVPPWSDHAHSGAFLSPGEYADLVSEGLETGVDIIGACCGSGPEHIKYLRKLIS